MKEIIKNPIFLDKLLFQNQVLNLNQTVFTSQKTGHIENGTNIINTDMIITVNIEVLTQGH